MADDNKDKDIDQKVGDIKPPDDFYKSYRQAASGEEPAAEKTPEEIAAEQKATTDAAAAATQEITDPYFKSLSSIYGTEEAPYIAPDEIIKGIDKDGKTITEARKFEILKEEIIKHEKKPEPQIDDPFVKSYLKASTEEKFDRVKFLEEEVKNETFLKLPAKDFLREFHRTYAKANKLEWTDEAINEEIDKLSNIEAEMQANSHKEKITALHDQEIANYNYSVETEIKKDLPLVQKEADVLTTSFMNSIKEKKKFSGFEFNDEDRKEFNEQFPTFTKKEIIDLNGQKQIASKADILLTEILGSPEKSLNMMVYLYLIDKGKLEGFISQSIEKNKEAIEKRLANESTAIQTGKGQTTDPGFDATAFIGAAKEVN